MDQYAGQQSGLMGPRNMRLLAVRSLPLASSVQQMANAIPDGWLTARSYICPSKKPKSAEPIAKHRFLNCAERGSTLSHHSAAIRNDWGASLPADKVVCVAAGF